MAGLKIGAATTAAAAASTSAADAAGAAVSFVLLIGHLSVGLGALPVRSSAGFVKRCGPRRGLHLRGLIAEHRHAPVDAEARVRDPQGLLGRLRGEVPAGGVFIVPLHGPVHDKALQVYVLVPVAA